MELHILVQKLWNNEQSTIRFIEQYYSNKIGRKLTIKLERSAQTSYFNVNTNEVVISLRNLCDLFIEYPSVGYKVYYTLLLHEIGHAIYTNQDLLIFYTDFLNILEDNRLEFQISLWNNRVKFDLLRYALQDKQLTPNIERIATNPTAIALALLRTVDNSPHVLYHSKTKEGAEIVDSIIKLNRRYMMIDKYSHEINHQDLVDMKNISTKVQELCEKLAQINRDQKQQQQQGQSSNGSKSNDSKPSDSQDQEDSTQQEKKITQANSTSGSSQEVEKPTSTRAGESLGKVDINELEKELKQLEQENREVRDSINNGFGTLYNPNPLQEPYEKINISAFTTLRRTGIKGSRDVSRVSGNAKQLSLRKYARREFVKNEKSFNRTLETLGKGGKSGKITFYLDISGSMESQQKLKISLNYLKSFYDSMSSHIEIRLMAFGTHTYEITRKELEHNFLRDKLEGTQVPNLVNTKRGEKIVIITDGEWPSRIPQQFLREANFVLIDDTDHIEMRFRSLGVRNITRVSPDSPKEIKEGLDKATNFIRGLLNK